MKIAVVTLSVATAGLGYLLYQAVTALPAACHTGYLVGWSERSQGKPLNHEDFGERILKMQRAERKAAALHRQMHAEGVEH